MKSTDREESSWGEEYRQQGWKMKGGVLKERSVAGGRVLTGRLVAGGRSTEKKWHQG